MDWNQVRQTPQQNGWDSIRNFVSSAGTALGTPIVKSLANIGALGANTLGNVQMALNKPESALKSYNRALAARQYAGTEGSFDQGFKSGAGTLVKGGLSALQTALTASGLKYVTPTKLLTTGGLGGVISKVAGGDFSTGAGQAVGSLPQILGFVGATNPILAKYLPKNSQISDRILGAGGNAIQGIGMDLARGTPTTPLGVGIDLATGALGGTTQFDIPNVKSLNPDVFVSDKNILNEAKQQLKTGIELDPFSKLVKDLDNMYKNYGLASYPDWNKLSIEERVNVLDDRVSEMAKQWGNNVKMGIIDDNKTNSTLKEINKFKELPHLGDTPSMSRPYEDVIGSFQEEVSKWTKGVEPEGKLNAYQLASDNWKLRRRLLKEQFGDWTGTTTVYRVGPATDDITSVFSDKNIAESYAKRMGVESINEFKAVIDDLVPSQSGSGELFVDKNSLIQSQPIKTGGEK